MTRHTGRWTLPDPWTRGRAHRSLENPAAAVSHSAHRPFLFFKRRSDQEPRRRPCPAALSLEANTG